MAVRYFKPLVINRIKSQATAQGMGRHSRSEVIEMGLKDLESISNYLGSVQPALFDLEQMIINDIFRDETISDGGPTDRSRLRHIWHAGSNSLEQSWIAL